MLTATVGWLEQTKGFWTSSRPMTLTCAGGAGPLVTGRAGADEGAEAVGARGPWVAVVELRVAAVVDNCRETRTWIVIEGRFLESVTCR